MNTAENLEERIRDIGGERSYEIIDAVKALAEIDIMIKDALDEIELVDDELVRRHNELAARINRLVEIVVAESGEDAAPDETGDGNEADPELLVKIEIQIFRSI